MPTRVTYNPLYWPAVVGYFYGSDSGFLGAAMKVGPIINETSDTVTHSGSVPDYKGKLQRGEQATSSLYGTRYRYNGGSGHCTVFCKKKVPTGYDDYVTQIWTGALGVNSGSAVPSNADASGLAQAHATAASVFNGRALKAQRALQGAVSVGELAQTLRMIKRPMQSLRRLMDNYLSDATKRAKGKKSKRMKKDAVADTWLEYSLGWRPLLADIDGLRDTLGRTQTEESRRDIYGSGTHKVMLGPFADNWEIDPVFSIKRRWKIVDLCSVRFVGQVRVRGGNPGLKDLLGVSGGNALPTLWELIPYSFIADYFANIGQVIDAVSLRNCDLIWAEKRQKISRTTTFLSPSFDPHGNANWEVTTSGGGGSSTITRDDVLRDVQLGWPIPHLVFKIPGIGQAQQWLNLAGLLASSRRASHAILG